MTALHTLEAKFQQALLQDSAPDCGVLKPRSVAQFNVYRIAYRARLRAALRDNFEVLPLVMGDDAFGALAHAYINAHPSTHFSLRWFGHRLCEFMEANESLVDHPALLDLARMDWALRHAFDAAHAEVLTFESLAAVPATDWAVLQFALHPSVQLLDLRWAVGPIWHGVKSGQSNLAPPEALDHCMLVWRPGMNTQWKSLTPIEAFFVKGIQAQRTFAQLCESLADHAGADQAAATAVTLLRDLLKTGALMDQSAQAPFTSTQHPAP